jgi:hypothetical protein
MSRFRKVSEIENIPTFLEKRFIGAQVEVEEDPYAELKRNSTAKILVLQKKQIISINLGKKFKVHLLIKT